MALLHKVPIKVSIHAPVKDETGYTAAPYDFMIGFNPRTRKGCDTVIALKDNVLTVSIHAPVKDATFFVRDEQYQIRFQSTHP